MTQPRWHEWAQHLQAIAQNGLAYAGSPYDIERYEAVRRIAAEIMAAGTEGDAGKIAGLFDRETGHATPKVDVRGVVFRGDTILLVREAADGLWTVPGGWADVGEAPSVGAAREVREESGYETRPVRLLALYDRNHPRHGHTPHPFHIFKAFFLCELVGGEARTSTETTGVDFFALGGLPELSVGRVTRSEIARFFEMRDHPEWGADFD